MNISMKLLILAAGAAPLFACASQTPTELIDARAAYRRAAAGPAAEHARPQLETAKRALSRAEEEFDDDGDDHDTRDFAYIAQRLSQSAEAQADVTLAQRDRAAAEQQLELAREQRQRSTDQQL